MLATVLPPCDQFTPKLQCILTEIITILSLDVFKKNFGWKVDNVKALKFDSKNPE